MSVSQPSCKRTLRRVAAVFGVAMLSACTAPHVPSFVSPDDTRLSELRVHYRCDPSATPNGVCTDIDSSVMIGPVSSTHIVIRPGIVQRTLAVMGTHNPQESNQSDAELDLSVQPLYGTAHAGTALVSTVLTAPSYRTIEPGRGHAERYLFNGIIRAGDTTVPLEGHGGHLVFHYTPGVEQTAVQSCGPVPAGKRQTLACIRVP